MSATFSGTDWCELLASRGSQTKAWLLIPEEPHRSSASTVISYQALYASTRRMAGELLARGLSRGDRVVVVAENNVETCLTFFAVWIAGGVAVPVAPPSLGRPNRSWVAALAGVEADCGARILVASQSTLGAAVGLSSVLLSLDELCSVSNEVCDRFENSAACSSGPGHDVALLQYTSGTTAHPRAVVLTHSNLFSAVRAIGTAFNADSSDIGVCWLPMFHDMGLIGSLLTATYWGMSLVLMRPRTFVMRPESWLWAISRFRATCSVAPNSAYEICASSIPEARFAGLELSHWRVAVVGAELVHPETIRAFTTKFAKHGFKPQAMFPAYGLAESTVAATLPQCGEVPGIDWVDSQALARDGLAEPRLESPTARGIVCVGSAFSGSQVRVCADNSLAALPDRQLGEVQLRGPCVMRGYYDDKTGSPLTADGWLRTGDRGYMVGDKLYLAGRDKHTIKRAGRTLDAATIEHVMARAPGVRSGGAAAFGVFNARTKSEELVVLIEASRDISIDQREALKREVVRILGDQMSLAPDVVSIVGPGAIPRTTSGKIRHSEARTMYLEKSRS